MPIAFACDACAKRVHVSREHAGKQGLCPHCRTRLVVPTLPGTDTGSEELPPFEVTGDDAAEARGPPPQAATAAELELERQRLELERQRLELQREQIQLERARLAESGEHARPAEPAQAPAPARRSPSARLGRRGSERRPVAPRRTRSERARQAGASAERGDSPARGGPAPSAIAAVALGALALIVVAIVVAVRGRDAGPAADDVVAGPDRGAGDQPPGPGSSGSDGLAAVEPSGSASPPGGASSSPGPAPFTGPTGEALEGPGERDVSAHDWRDDDPALDRRDDSELDPPPERTPSRRTEASVWLTTALAHLRVEDYAEAERVCDEGLTRVTDDPDLWLTRARARSAQEEWAGALADAERAVQLAPEEPLAYFLRGLARTGQDGLDGALHDFTKTLTLEPGHVQARWNRAVLLRRRERFADALEDLAELATTPEATGNPDFHALRGECRRGAGDTEGALEDFEDAAALHSNAGRTDRAAALADAAADLRAEVRRGPAGEGGTDEEVVRLLAGAREALAAGRLAEVREALEALGSRRLTPADGAARDELVVALEEAEGASEREAAEVEDPWPAEPDRRDLGRLFRAWRELELGSEEFRLVDAGFRRVALDPRTLDDFRDELDDPERGPLAAGILAEQLVLSTRDPDEIAGQWDVLEARHRAWLRRFRVRGQDLQAGVELPPGARRLYGGNPLLSPPTALDLPLPEWTQEQRFVLRIVLFAAADGEETTVRLFVGEDGYWSVLVRGGEWVVPTGEDTEFATPIRGEGWHELRWTVRPKAGRARYARTLEVAIDGEVLLERGDCNGRLDRLELRPRGRPLVVGAVDLMR